MYFAMIWALGLYGNAKGTAQRCSRNDVAYTGFDGRIGLHKLEAWPPTICVNYAFNLSKGY